MRKRGSFYLPDVMNTKNLFGFKNKKSLKTSFFGLLKHNALMASFIVLEMDADKQELFRTEN